VIKEATAARAEVKANEVGYMMAEDCPSNESCKIPNTSAYESASRSGEFRHYIGSCNPAQQDLSSSELAPSVKVHDHFVEALTRAFWAAQTSVWFHPCMDAVLSFVCAAG
jgi:hypothetical protein